MAFEHFVKCDRDGCNSRQQVPQPGAIPHNWIRVRYAKMGRVGRMELTQPEPADLILCSWKCLLKHASGFVREEVEKVKA